MNEYVHYVRPLVSSWVEKIRLAMEYKNRRFGKEAAEGMKFFAGPYDWLYSGKNRGENYSFRLPDDVPAPTCQMSLNKASELVQLFGPTLYHRNPIRQVNPRKIPDIPAELFINPMDPNAGMMLQQMSQQQMMGRQIDAARATILQTYLNATPTMTDLKTESRWAITEAMIKGMGVTWVEPYKLPGAQHTITGSFYDSIDNLVIDPDMKSIRDAKWIARRCVHPVWEVEREYGIPPGQIKGDSESHSQAGTVNADPDGNYMRATGQTNDLVTYWKIYSKMGVGDLLSGFNPVLKGQFQSLGDYCYIVVTDKLDYPLNISPELMANPDPAALMAATGWPTPFWADDSWPFAEFLFHRVPGDVWPQSPLAPAMGELKFLNWAYSWVATKIQTTCRDFITIPKSLDDEFKQAIKSGKDLTLIEIDEEHVGTVDRIVGFIQHPAFNGDIWKVIEAIGEQFDRRTGLTELMYGQTGRQLRSAAEADLKAGQTNIRPDDMANSVEDSMSLVAKLEAFAARWHLTPPDVVPILGEMGAQIWGQLVYGADPSQILHGYDYRIEAGSARKPNRDRDAANMNQAMQNLFQPLLQACMASGNMEPVNAMVRAWGRTMDMDVDELGILFPAPPPPMMPPGPPPEPQPAA